MSVPSFVALKDAALIHLRAKVPEAEWSYVNSIDAGKIDGRRVLLTPGSMPLTITPVTRASDEGQVQLAISIIDKWIPGQNADPNVELLEELGRHFLRAIVGGYSCVSVSCPVLMDPELSFGNAYQGVVELTFKAIQ